MKIKRDNEKLYDDSKICKQTVKECFLDIVEEANFSEFLESSQLLETIAIENDFGENQSWIIFGIVFDEIMDRKEIWMSSETSVAQCSISVIPIEMFKLLVKTMESLLKGGV